MENRNPNWNIFGIDFGPRRRRRLAVVVLYAAYPAAVASFALGSQHPAWFALSLLCMGTAGAAFWVLNQFALPYAEQAKTRSTPGVVPDERQLQVRDRSFFRAYQILAGTGSLWLLYQSLGVDLQRKIPGLWLPKTYDQHSLIFWTFLILSITVPNALIAWTEPDVEG